MHSFTFNNKNSLADFGIYIANTPTIASPERKVSFIAMPGRSGTLRYDEDAYDDITISLNCGIMGNVNDKVEKIKTWLFESAESDLVFSFSSDKKYMAQVVNRIDFELPLRQIGSFVILFHCRPFQYSVMNIPLSIVSSNTNLINIGSVKSQPIIEVYGSGDAEIKIGEDSFKLKNISERLFVNSELQEVYSQDFKNLNSIMEGEFPQLIVGDNNISWTGNITKLLITPNWRWL